MFGVNSIPANSTRTYFSTPELSALSVPPKITAGVIPSIAGSGWFTGALPRITKPPQSPLSRVPAGNAEVNIIGSAAVPSANNFPPLSITRVPLVALSPKTTVPG